MKKEELVKVENTTVGVTADIILVIPLSVDYLGSFTRQFTLGK